MRGVASRAKLGLCAASSEHPVCGLPHRVAVVMNRRLPVGAMIGRHVRVCDGVRTLLTRCTAPFRPLSTRRRCVRPSAYTLATCRPRSSTKRSSRCFSTQVVRLLCFVSRYGRLLTRHRSVADGCRQGSQRAWSDQCVSKARACVRKLGTNRLTVYSVQINPGKNFAFAEFSSLDACTAALSLDGIMCEGNALKVGQTFFVFL